MGKVSFDVLAAFPQKRFSTLALHRDPRLAQGAATNLAQLVLAALRCVGIAHDRADPFALERTHLLEAEVAFIGGEAFGDLLLFRIVADPSQGFAAFHDPFADPLAVPGISRTHFRPDDRAGLQIGEVLGLVDHVAGPVLGPAHLRFRIVGTDPVLVGGLAPFAFLVEATHRLGVVGIDPGLGGEFLHVAPVVLLGIAMLQFTQTGVGFDDGAV